jgi:hypothetical protein
MKTMKPKASQELSKINSMVKNASVTRSTRKETAQTHKWQLLEGTIPYGKPSFSFCESVKALKVTEAYHKQTATPTDLRALYANSLGKQTITLMREDVPSPIHKKRRAA